MPRKRLMTALVLVGLLAACSSNGGSSNAPGNVTASLKEWEFTLDPTSGAAGEVTFNITNDGDKTHEFVVVATDTLAADIPVDPATDEVDEAQFTPVDEVEDITSGSTATLTVTLEAGHYVILCNLTGHYAKGMYSDFTVN